MENFLKGKSVLFMGDSITALYMCERGWPKYFCETLEVGHHMCTAVAGAHWCDYKDTVYDGNPVFLKDTYNPNNTMGNQVEKIRRAVKSGDERYKHFDVIIMAAGSNDAMPESSETCDAQYRIDGAYLPLEKADRMTWGGSVRYVCESLYELYPEAQMFICGPIQADDKIRSFRSILEKGNFLHDICARLSVDFVDTIHCGIYGRYEKWGENGRSLVDGLHPNAYGAKQMASFIAGAVRARLG